MKTATSGRRRRRQHAACATALTCDQNTLAALRAIFETSSGSAIRKL
jgi:hypothetical protein